MQSEETRNILLKHVNGPATIYTKNGFRFQCLILEVGESIVTIRDTKKNFEKMLQLENIQEIDFHD